MTKRHFIAIAEALRSTRDFHGLPDTWSETVVKLADVCAELNLNFNREKFYEMAGAAHLNPTERTEGESYKGEKL